MLSREDLLARHCRPLEGGSAMAPSEVQAQLAALDGWGLVDNCIVRTYRFDDYHQTIAFVNALAEMIHAEDHHPVLIVSFNRCEVRFSTHSVKGISENDFICAAKADAIYAQRAGRRSA